MEKIPDGTPVAGKSVSSELEINLKTKRPKNEKTVFLSFSANNMNDIFRFRNFKVYKDARQLRKELRDLCKKKFPKEEQFCLTSQLWRAMDSVLLNIAEGSDRYSDIDFGRFLNNSSTSLDEVAACLDCAMDSGYITEDENKIFSAKAENILRQLKAFSAKVRKDNR